MRKFTGYGPSLIVLVTAAVVLLLGPRAVQQLTYQRTKSQIIQARHSLESNDILARMNQAYRDIGTMVEPSVVHVSAQYVTKTAGIEQMGLSTGSGWIYDDQGHIVTNNHVIQNAVRIDVQLYDGDLREAVLVGADPSTDVAVIKISSGRLHAAVVADLAEPVKQGDLVFAFGSPFDFRFSMSSGVVSGKDRSVNIFRDDFGRRLGYENFIQVDAAINPGNSGGPLTDFRGRVIGMNTAIATGPRNSLEEGQFAGIGLAIPMEMIQPAVTQLIKNGFVEKGFLGVNVPLDNTMNAVLLQRLGFNGQGVLITGVDQHEAAGLAGVRPRDVVTQINGRSIATIAQLQSFISSMLPGEIARLTVWRSEAGQPLENLASSPESSEGFAGPIGRSAGRTLEIPVQLRRLDMLRAGGVLPPDQNRQSIPGIGIARMSTSTPELADRFGVPYFPGVMLEELVPGATFGSLISPGATIVAVRDRSVRNVDEFIKELQRSDSDLRRGVIADAQDATGFRKLTLVVQ